jgi:succinate dehydrogenase / fumarate reductase cytochrome b subunit
VLFHALNGIRVILIDFWAQGPRYQRHMLAVAVTVFVIALIAGLGVLGMHMTERFL